MVAKAQKTSGFNFPTIKHVECVERIKPLAVRVRGVNATLLDAAYVEGLSIDELHDQNAKEIYLARSAASNCRLRSTPQR